jgi:SAM-dependent methyltransferase
MARDAWVKGDAYELYVGRWSTTVAHEFVGWLGLPAELRWLDAGCGTGALTAKVLELGRPRSVTGADPSEGFLAKARERVEGARFCVADAQALPFADNAFDVVVSGLALNFVPDPAPRLVRIRAGRHDHGSVRVGLRPGHADDASLLGRPQSNWSPRRVGSMRGCAFRSAGRNPCARSGSTPGSRASRWKPIDVPTVFDDFDDYWSPFLGGQGPAPGFAMSLSPERRDALRALIRERLPFDAQGRIPLTARAWAVARNPLVVRTGFRASPARSEARRQRPRC